MFREQINLALVLALSVLVAFASCSRQRRVLKEEVRPPAEKPVETAQAPAPTAAVPGTQGPAEPSGEVTAATIAPDETASPEATFTFDPTSEVMILGYHRFEERPTNSMAIKPGEFEKQMQALKDAGVTVIGMNDFLAWKRGERNIPKKSALITIDDGYNCGYEVAWPILKEYGYPLTLFVYLDYVESGGRSITWDRLREMAQAGVTIGSHSASHARLTARKGKSDEGYRKFLEDEIAGSKKAIEERIGVEVNTFAFPYGIYSDAVRKTLAESGYAAAFNVNPQPVNYTTPLDNLNRFVIHSDKPETFANACNYGRQLTPHARSSVKLASSAIITYPVEGEIVSEARPEIRANLSSLGDVDPGSVEMRISGFGVVPARFDAKAKTVTYRPVQKLRQRTCTVLLTAKANGKKVRTEWTFAYDPRARERLVEEGYAAEEVGVTEPTATP